MEPVQDGTPRRILLVEDNEDDYLVTCRALRIALGHTVILTWIDRYQAALPVMRPGAYDLYLIADRLDAHTRIDLLHALGERGDTTPVVLLTEGDDPDTDVRATEVGAVASLIKTQRNASSLARAIRAALHPVPVGDAEPLDERRFQTLIEHSADGIAVFGPDYTIRYASPSTTRILGYTPEEVVQCGLFDLIHPDDRALVAQRIAAGYGAGGTTPTRTLRMCHKDGTYRWLEYVSTVLHDDPRGAFVVNYRDITERMRVEETRWLHERAVTAATSGIVITDARNPDHPIIYVNQGFERLTGYTAAESLGHNCRFLQGADADAATCAHVRQALATGQTCQVVLRNYRKNGTPFWNELVLSPVRDDAGTLTHFIGVQEDVSARVQADEALRVSEHRARAQYEGNPTPTHTWQRVGDDWVSIDYNAAADRLASEGIHTLLGQTARERFHALPDVLYDLDRCARDQTVIEREIQWAFPPDEAARDFMNRFVPVGETLITQYTEDITERKRAEQWRTHLAAVVDSSTDAIIGETLAGTVISWNGGAERLYGYTAAEMIGRAKSILFPPDRADDLERIMAQVARGEHVHEYETQRMSKNGRVREMSINIAPIRDGQGAVVAASTIARDISERKQYETRLIHDATHDALTGLPNRALLLSHLQAQIDRVSREAAYQFAVLFLDIDRFKYVNDSLGHLLGDELLRTVAQRLRLGLSRHTTIARLGGDEFVVLIPGVPQGAAAMRAAEALQAVLTQPIALDGQELVMSASIGIVLSSAAYTRPDELLRDADTAMYEAKRHGHAGVALFDRAMHARVTRAMRLEQDLRHALDRGEFALWYQPIVTLAEGALLGFEALVRWENPMLGIIPPDEFIRLAEETGLIGTLDRWVLKQACAQMQDWGVRFPGAAHLSVNVNLSGKDLAHPEFATAILSILEETGLAPARLHVEITETALIEHAHLAVPLLTTLRGQGVGVYLDDFGTGYSSLTYLRDLPIDAVKIDRAFVRDAMGESSEAILMGVVAIAHKLKLHVIAEGVEHETQAAHLRAIGCDGGQGYLYAPPRTVLEVEETLRQVVHGLPAGT